MSKRAEKWERVRKLIEQEYYVFKHDTLRRCKTRAEVVAALRQLKTTCLDKIRSAGAGKFFVDNAVHMIDQKIAILTSDQEATLKVKPKKKKTIWLPGFIRHRKIKPPEAN